MYLRSFASQPPLPLCSLNPALPHLKDDEGNDVQFRRTLLNKCQVRSGASAGATLNPAHCSLLTLGQLGLLPPHKLPPHKLRKKVYPIGTPYLRNICL